MRRHSWPTPNDLGILIPPPLRPERFNRGFRHGLRGRQLDRVDYFRLSFRMGFRASRLYLREIRRRRGIIEFPLRARIRLRALWR